MINPENTRHFIVFLGGFVTHVAAWIWLPGYVDLVGMAASLGLTRLTGIVIPRYIPMAIFAIGLLLMAGVAYIDPSPVDIDLDEWEQEEL